MRCEYAKISDGMAARGRHQGRESRDEGQRRKFHRRGAIGPGLLEVERDASVGQDVQPVVGKGWAQDIAAQGQATLLVVGGDPGCSLQVETVGLRAQVAAGDGTVVGVEHDADGLALVGGTIGWSAGGGRGQEPGQERISAKVSSPTTVTSPSPGAVTRVMTPRRWRKRRMRLPARDTSCSTSCWVGAGQVDLELPSRTTLGGAPYVWLVVEMRRPPPPRWPRSHFELKERVGHLD